MYMQKCTCKILNTEQKKRGKEPGCSSINTTVLNKCYLLWLEKTMLAPTCTISSLLILTITVRRTRWSVGRGVLRVVTQAYQGDEETRLTEPRYCWPTTLHSSPLCWANRALHLYSFTGSALCLVRHHCSASSGSQNKMECEHVSYLPDFFFFSCQPGLMKFCETCMICWDASNMRNTLSHHENMNMRKHLNTDAKVAWYSRAAPSTPENVLYLIWTLNDHSFRKNAISF